MSPDEVIDKYESKKIKIEMKYIQPEDGGCALVYIKGDTNTLKMISDIFGSVSEGKDEFGSRFHLSPDGAGYGYFTKESNIGIYIEKI